jgi:SAM-dependent methyltransferase
MSAPFKSQVSVWQRLADHIFFPLNLWLSEETSFRLGLTPIDHERIRAVLPYCKGRLLDVACGKNLLVRAYGNGIGADVHSYLKMDVRCDSKRLPFKNCVFDSLSLLACLNHITARKETLAECSRVLKGDGRLLITMIPKWVGFFSHPIRKRHDPDQLERGISRDEEWGLSASKIVGMIETAGFRVTKHSRFMWGLNHFFLAEKCACGVLHE